MSPNARPERVRAAADESVRATAGAATPAARWLLLIHAIPPKPDYFRVKVGKRLQRLGAVPVKRSVYVLPANEGTLEDFQWLAREIAAEGGDATVCRAAFVEGLRDEQVEALFQNAREADYSQIADELRALASRFPQRLSADDERRAPLEAELGKVRRRLQECAELDFFGAPGRETAEAAVASLEHRLARDPPRAPEAPTPQDYSNRIWVTRKNVHVDRIGSAWLIRRFIDPGATFKFVAGQGYRAAPQEVTFDMLDGHFTHIGDQCTFEVLVTAFELHEPGLLSLAEIVHDIDVKDGKFGRAEAPGIAALISGIALSEPGDEPRIALGERMFTALLERYRRKRA